MASQKAFFRREDGTMFRFDRNTNLIEVQPLDEKAVSEVLSDSLIKRLTAQGVPSALWSRRLYAVN
jgi:ribosomal protein L14